MDTTYDYTVYRRENEDADDFMTRVFKEMKVKNCEIINVHLHGRYEDSDGVVYEPSAFSIKYKYL
jgi:hypothetical protein